MDHGKFTYWTGEEPSEICGVVTRGMLARCYDLVELARVCWRQSQTAWTPEAACTLRRIAREYLQQATKLHDGKVPDIGLVCLKAQQGHSGRGR
jgi:hypothetical protein